MRILNEREEAILHEERKHLNDLRVILAQFGLNPEDQEVLGNSIQQLDELFLLVIVGEFNAGKSAFINALLGKPLLTEGVTPTTTQINILRFGETQERLVVDDHQHIVTFPEPMLEEISIVDTPGTNAIIREHETITSEFVPRSDLVLFITSSDRPFTESERQFMEQIRDWGKKVVIVVNKIDILQSNEELTQVLDFVGENARMLLGITPEIFPVSSRQALRAKTGIPELWEKSRFEPLERYIQETLDEKGRLILKFLNPLGVGSHLVNKYLSIIYTRLEVLKADFQMLEDVEAQLGLYREDMRRDFNYRMADIDNILLGMEQRGEQFFEETFRLARVFDLLSKDYVRREFEKEVVGEVPQLIERKVIELIDWLVDSDLRQWKAVTDHLSERRREHEDRIVGDAGPGTFHYDRERLMDAVGREALRVVETYDKTRESQAIAEGAQAAVAASAAVEAGAVGLGTLVAVMATTVAADVTGVLLASFVAALGLFIIPARRSGAKREMRAKIAAMREQLSGSLRTQFEREINRSLSNINDAIAPYTRFVRAEREKLTTTQVKLEGSRASLDRLKANIDELYNS